MLSGISGAGYFFPNSLKGLGFFQYSFGVVWGSGPKPCTRFREVPKEWNRFRSEGSIHETLGSERFRSEGSIHETLGSERFRSEGSIHETLGSERFRSQGSIHEMLGSERFRSQGSIHETVGSERFRSQGSIHETLGHFSKYGMCLHITCFVFHIACFLFHIACFLLLILCQSEKQFLSTSCWGFHMGLFFCVCVRVLLLFLLRWKTVGTNGLHVFLLSLTCWWCSGFWCYTSLTRLSSFIHKSTPEMLHLFLVYPTKFISKSSNAEWNHVVPLTYQHGLSPVGPRLN